MQEQVVIHFPTLLAWCGLIVAIGGALKYVKGWLKPLTKPYNDIQDDLDDIEKRSASCAKKFANDEARLNEHEKALEALAEDNKFILESVALLLQHAETGNGTGAIREYRKNLETYLINRGSSR